MNKFKRLVNESGMSLYALAKKANVANQDVYKYAKGVNKNPSLETGFKLADALGIDINELRNAFGKDD
ncbi:helix-turn-helix transcriptional regulator [Atopobacter phocae]|uniref:helix-turn-helix transcriptional regulator n=1 Tax=Atopobacter phocae TaxID=136492 RepID=UPI00046F497F|nr:helix-turn-helix transcriptional regulator [Atopobacter phocae]